MLDDHAFAELLCPTQEQSGFFKTTTLESTQTVLQRTQNMQKYAQAERLQIFAELPFNEATKVVQFQEDGVIHIKRREIIPLQENLRVSAPAQTDQCEESCQCDIKPDDRVDDYFKHFPRSKVNKMVKKAKVIKTFSRLSNFLKSKYFMRLRDHSLITTMVNDARVWMLKQGFTLETEDDYFVMTQSVIVSFLVQEQEMKFRKILKEPENWDNMAHLNNTAAGKLGKVNLLRAMQGENSLLGGFLPDLKFPAATRPVV